MRRATDKANWSSVVHRPSSKENSMQYRDLFLWYFWVQAFALGGSFLAQSWLRRLPDHGYGLGKAAQVIAHRGVVGVIGVNALSAIGAHQ